jgi:peptide/nickel transport system permease protein
VSARDRVRRFLRRAPLIPIFILLLVCGAGLFANLLAPQDALTGELIDRYKPPFWMSGSDPRFVLGTDHLGRDIVSRMLFGARISLVVVALAIVIGGTVGTVLGLVSGHFGGLVDEVIMRLVDLQFALPLILVSLVLLVVFGSSIEILIGITSLWLWPTYARLVRAEILRVRTLDYVTLARVAGASTPRILFVHELPAVVNTIVVVATLQAGWVILLEGSLSYLGVGVPPPTPSWGSMIADGRTVIASATWVSTFPGVAMVLTVLSLNLLGDWLRDVLDPKRTFV